MSNAPKGFDFAREGRSAKRAEFCTELRSATVPSIKAQPLRRRSSPTGQHHYQAP
jgi:hypothetical protein